MDDVASAAEQTLGIHPRALDLLVPIGPNLVPATLNVPLGARGVVAVFAPQGHSRYDAPVRFFAQVLEQAGLATLTLDADPWSGVDELPAVVQWLQSESFTHEMSIGLLRFEPGSPRRVPTGVTSLVVAEWTARAAELASEYFVVQLSSSLRPSG